MYPTAAPIQQALLTVSCLAKWYPVQSPDVPLGNLVACSKLFSSNKDIGTSTLFVFALWTFVRSNGLSWKNSRPMIIDRMADARMYPTSTMQLNTKRSEKDDVR